MLFFFKIYVQKVHTQLDSTDSQQQPRHQMTRAQRCLLAIFVMIAVTLWPTITCNRASTPRTGSRQGQVQARNVEAAIGLLTNYWSCGLGLVLSQIFGILVATWLTNKGGKARQKRTLLDQYKLRQTPTLIKITRLWCRHSDHKIKK